jgi:hypothetical protein
MISSADNKFVLVTYELVSAALDLSYKPGQSDTIHQVILHRYIPQQTIPALIKSPPRFKTQNLLEAQDGGYSQRDSAAMGLMPQQSLARKMQIPEQIYDKVLRFTLNLWLRILLNG